MKRRTFIVLLLSFLFKFSYAQDPLFSQYHSNALYLNPAFAGAFNNPIFAASYRSQWPSLEGNYKTAMVQFHQFSPALHGGIGGYALYDNAGGTIVTELAKLVYSYRLCLNRNITIQPAIGVGYTNKHLNMDNLTFGDPIDPRYGFIYNTRTPSQPNSNQSFVDFTTGLLIYSHYLYGGLAIDHLTEPNEGFFNEVKSPLPRKYTVHAGANIPLNDSLRSIYFSPAIIYLSQADFKTWQAEMTFKIKWALLGIGYRKDDALIFYAGYEGNRFRITYSYDKATSKLADVNAYSHEVFLSYILKYRPHRPWLRLKSISF